MNFGGVTTFMTPCSCSGNFLLTIIDKRGTVWNLIYQPMTTIVYSMYQVRPEVNTLGLFIPGVGGCFSGGSCTYVPTQGTIFMMGTSMSAAASIISK